MSENPWKVCDKEVPDQEGVGNIVIGQFQSGEQRPVSYQLGPDTWFDIQYQCIIPDEAGLVLWRYEKEDEELDYVACAICQEPFDFEPVFCCSGRDCICEGRPLNKPICSFECNERHSKLEGII